MGMGYLHRLARSVTVELKKTNNHVAHSKTKHEYYSLLKIVEE